MMCSLIYLYNLKYFKPNVNLQALCLLIIAMCVANIDPYH